MFGPDVPAKGEIADSQPVFQRDIAPTILTLLGVDPAEYKGVTGKPIDISAGVRGTGQPPQSHPETR